MTQARSYALVTIGAALWGCVGIFVHGLLAHGVSAIQIAWIRMLGGTIAITIWILRTSPTSLRLKQWSDLRYFVLTGAVSIAVFQWSYITAISTVGISTAVILLYTAPGFVVLFSRIFFGEPITGIKLLSLLVMFLGVVAVTGGFDDRLFHENPAGIITGLMAGLSFSVYTVVGKRALLRYSARTVTVYTFAIAALALTPAALMRVAPVAWASPGVIAWGTGIIAFPTIAAYLLYTTGLVQTEPGRASIVGTVEVLVAIGIGIVFFGDPAGVAQIIGALLVIAAALGVRWSR